MLKKGGFKDSSVLQQFLILIGITLLSFVFSQSMGMLLITALTGISQQEMLLLLKAKTPPPSLGNVIRGLQLVQFIGLFLVPSLIVAYLFSADSSRHYLRLGKPVHWGFWFVGVSALLFTLPMVVWLGEVNRNLPFPPGLSEWIHETENQTSGVLESLLSLHSISDLLLNLFFLAGLAGIGEELFFRGVLQKMFTRWFGQAWPAILLTAFIFSAVHMQFLGFFPRFVLGILLGAIYWYSGSIWVAMLSHFAYNAIQIIIVYFFSGTLEDKPSVADSQALMITGLISALFVTIHLHWMIRHKAPDKDQEGTPISFKPNP